jgi:hypothetical protein
MCSSLYRITYSINVRNAYSVHTVFPRLSLLHMILVAFWFLRCENDDPLRCTSTFRRAISRDIGRVSTKACGPSSIILPPLSSTILAHSSPDRRRRGIAVPTAVTLATRACESPFGSRHPSGEVHALISKLPKRVAGSPPRLEIDWLFITSWVISALGDSSSHQLQHVLPFRTHSQAVPRPRRAESGSRCPEMDSFLCSLEKRVDGFSSSQAD